MTPNIRLRQPLLPILIAFLLGLQLIGPSRAWTTLLVIFTGVFVSAYLWTRSLGRNLQVRRETHLGWVQVGGQIEERITLSNTALLPASWVEFMDRSTLPDFAASRFTGISGGSFDQWNVRAVCRQRGLFTLGDAQIETGDPFGIFDVSIHAPQRTSILVLPQVTTLPDLYIAPAGSHGDGQPRRHALQQTIHASTVREYAYGDSTRQIHWPTTARMNKVFVRLMESAPEGNWWILLDLDRRNMFGTGWESVEEHSVALAASLADFGLRARKSVGLITNGEELGWLPPQKGEGQRWEIMQALALAKPGRRTLSSLLEKMHPSLGKYHSLIVITASTKADWLNSFSSFMKRGIIPTVILLDASTFGAVTSMENIAGVIEQRGIKCHVIPKGVIEPPKLDIGETAKWTWRTTSSGEVIPVRN
jgi:uncharacterized protein (DUF58 family)